MGRVAVHTADNPGVAQADRPGGRHHNAGDMRTPAATDEETMTPNRTTRPAREGDVERAFRVTRQQEASEGDVLARAAVRLSKGDDPLAALPPDHAAAVAFFVTAYSDLLPTPAPLVARVLHWIELADLTAVELRAVMAGLLDPFMAGGMRNATVLLADLSAEVSYVLATRSDPARVRPVM